jgi:hypothetical protein
MGSTSLYLDGKSLTDNCLENVAAMKNLRIFYINRSIDSAITEEGVNKLSEALPNCTIQWRGGTIKPK